LNGIIVKDLPAFKARFYTWGQISQVTEGARTYYSHGQARSDVFYIIHFADGSAWKLDQGRTFFHKRQEFPQAAGFVASEIGKQIESNGE
jgi:hypothetical protein